MQTRKLAAVAVLFLAGCNAVGPNYKAPEIKTPDAWQNAFASNLTKREGDITLWWENFKDPLLSALIERAAQNNHDLQIAEARIWEARFEYGIVDSRDKILADLNASGIRSRRSGNTATTPPGISRVSSLWQVGFDAVWEIDVFGGIFRARQAASADYDATIEDFNSILISLIGEVARNYIDFRTIQNRIDIAKENIKSQEETLRLAEVRFKAGMTNDLDVARAEALVARTRSQIPSLESSLKRIAHRISVLMGEEPSLLWKDLMGVRSMMQAPVEIPIGLPADLLRRRPDLRRAERELAAATARVGIATADLYPKFSLVGSLGLQNKKFLELTHQGSTAYTFGPSMSWALLDGGRNRAAVHAEDARMQQALLRYQQSTLTALEEVEDAMSAYSSERERRDYLSKAMESSKRAAKLANELYEKGLTDFNSVLESNRTLYDYQDSLALSENLISTGLVSIYKALGGGWTEEEFQEPTTSQTADEKPDDKPN